MRGAGYGDGKGDGKGGKSDAKGKAEDKGKGGSPTGKGVGRSKEPPAWRHTEFATKVVNAKVAKEYQELKGLLVEVAESNYRARDCWPVPRTIPVPYAQGSKHIGKAQKKTKITFSRMDTADALLYFASKGEAACGLNFGNGETAGGGYKSGSSAQEEDLCRRIPTLYSSLFNATKDGLYPFGPCTCSDASKPAKYSDVLFTSGLVVARAGEEDGFAWLPSDRQQAISLVTACAPNIRFAKEVNDPELVYRTIENVFKAPNLVEPELTTLILGAFGCGAFGGNPEEISELFVQALIRDNLGQPYKEVHFAIPQTSPSDNNQEVFRKVFEKYKVDIVDTGK